jgi:hypothetical protein
MYVEKNGLPTYVIFEKLPKVYNRPMGEKSKQKLAQWRKYWDKIRPNGRK